MTYSGLNNTTLTPIRQTHTMYNVLGEPTSVMVKDLAPQSGQSITSVTTTTAYDDLGRVTSVSDPDQGSWTNSYDAGGNLASTVSGTRTLGYNYDLLGRVGCVQDAVPTANATGACSAGNPLAQNTYDTTMLGKQGSTDFPIGSLTQSVATTYYPEGTSATVTEQFQHDQRGRLTSTQMQFGLPSTWGLTLPTYQAAISYNDADQPVTTTTSSNPSGQGSTWTFAYDSTGALAGLSNTTSTTPNLATLLYNANGLLDTIQFLSSTGGPLANDQFGYDATLRPTSTNVTWQGGSGQSGTILSQQRSYDNASNVLSLTTTEGAVSGQSGTGGSETQNFCYNEQNQLVWAGNSGTQPAPGNGTCGSATLSSGFNQTGASYNASFVSTHLGQLWQGPLNGGSTQQQYLYCDSSHPHQLSGLFPVGTTCASQSGAVYSSSYDAWGNVTGRTFSGTTATLSYDTLNHFTEWKASATNQEWYLYDAAGQRVLRRSTTGSGTTLIAYPFGTQEDHYDSTGTNSQNIYYYALAGHLIGSLDNMGTRYYLTDALGSILSNITNVAGGASLKGEQLFGPYGNTRYNTPDINTAKGFTGQYQDTTGLDYYGARYYDPVAGVFLSADSAQGNRSGMNPYAYVGGNPETNVDPTGERFVSNGDNGSGVYSSGGGQSGGGLCSYAQYGCGGGGGGLGSGAGWCIYSQAGCGGSSPARVVIPHVVIPHHTAPVFPGVGASSGGQDTPNPCNGLTKTDCMPAIWNTRVRVGGTGMMGVNICEGFCFTFQVPVQYYGETSIGIPGCATAFSCLVHADGGAGLPIPQATRHLAMLGRKGKHRRGMRPRLREGESRQEEKEEK